MRVVAYVLSVLVFTVLAVLGVLGFAVLSDADSTWMPSLAGGGLALALSGSLTVGALAAWWQRGQADGGRHFRVWRRWLAVAAGVGLVMMVVGGLLSRTPVWYLAIVVVVVIALHVIAAPIGDRVRQTADRHGPRASDAWTPDNRVEIRRLVRTTALTFAIALVVVAIAAVVLSMRSDEALDLRLLLLAAALPFFAAGVACSIAALRLTRRARALAGNDFARLRMLTRVVLKGADDNIDEEDQRAAARYAVLAPAVLGAQLGPVLLLYCGLTLQLLAQSRSGMLPTSFPLIMAGLLVVGLAISVPQTLVRTRRARAYAARHRDLLDDEDAVTSG